MSTLDDGPSPEEIREMADEMRDIGFDALADRLAEGADTIEEQTRGVDR